MHSDLYRKRIIVIGIDFQFWFSESFNSGQNIYRRLRSRWAESFGSDAVLKDILVRDKKLWLRISK